MIRRHCGGELAWGVSPSTVGGNSGWAWDRGAANTRSRPSLRRSPEFSMAFRTTSPVQRRTFRICAIAAGLLASGVALADAQLDPQLTSRMQEALPTDQLQIVVSYEQSGPVSAGQVAALKSLGIDQGVLMRTLPIAGALATPAEIRALAQRDDVASIYFNAPLNYFNNEARQISGAERAVQNPGDSNRAIPFSGAGVGVVVNDSAVDAPHQELKLQRKRGGEGKR